MEQKIILLSTPTSATGSLWRLVQEISGPGLKACSVIDHYLSQNVEFNDIKNKPLPDGFDLFLFNQPHLFNFNQNLEDYKFVVNFRDPRDLNCNQYYWVFEHPVAPEMEEKAKITRERVAKEGIDYYCKNSDLRFFYEPFAQLLNSDCAKNTLVVSYAQICLLSDLVIDNLNTFLGNKLSGEEIIKIKNREFPSALNKNPNWISGKWKGGDLLPGRARLELTRETFIDLTVRYKSVLELMKKYDIPHLAAVYE